MANKQIQSVTLDEINTARSESLQPTNQQISTKKAPDYLNKLKDSEIENFFKPFGFLAMVRGSDFGEDNMIGIACEDFDVAISNFDVAVNFNQTTSKNSSTFDIGAFLDYCDKIDTSPEKALADIIQIELLGQKFHSYNKNFIKTKQTERKQAFNELPTSMKKLVKTLDQKREHELEGISTKLSYGDFEGDPQANKTF